MTDTAGPSTDESATGTPWYGDIPVLVYPGLHKTGSSWLKTAMFSGAAGRDFVYVDDRTVTRGSFLIPEEPEFSEAAAVERFRPFAEDARRRGLPMVVADEALAGFPFNSKRFLRDLALGRIASVFPTAKVLVTIREQARVIQSVYGHYIRGGHSASLRTFLAEPPAEEAALWDPLFDRRYYDYDRLWHICEAKFGRNAVLFAPMEWTLAEPEAFDAALAKLTGVAWPRIDAKRSGRVVNAGWSGPAYWSARQANKLFRTGPNWKKSGTARVPGRLAYWVDKFTPSAIRDRAQRAEAAFIRQEIGDIYAESNRRLAERLGLDLRGFGYRVS